MPRLSRIQRLWSTPLAARRRNAAGSIRILSETRYPAGGPKAPGNGRPALLTEGEIIGRNKQTPLESPSMEGDVQDEDRRSPGDAFIPASGVHSRSWERLSSTASGCEVVTARSARGSRLGRALGDVDVGRDQEADSVLAVKAGTILLSGPRWAMASFGTPRGHSLSVGTRGRDSPRSRHSMDAHPRTFARLQVLSTMIAPLLGDQRFRRETSY